MFGFTTSQTRQSRCLTAMRLMVLCLILATRAVALALTIPLGVLFGALAHFLWAFIERSLLEATHALDLLRSRWNLHAVVSNMADPASTSMATTPKRTRRPRKAASSFNADAASALPREILSSSLHADNDN